MTQQPNSQPVASQPGDSPPVAFRPGANKPGDSRPGDSRPGDYQPVDGNTLGGPLREIFVGDVTAATWRCAGCGTRGAVAQLRVYDRGPGIVARCFGCEAVVLRLVRGRDRAWLELQGPVCLPLHPVS